MRKPLIFSLIFLVFILPLGLSRADELGDVTKELNEQKQQLSDLEKRKEQLAQEIASASVSLVQVSAELEEAEADLAKIRKDLSEREKTLEQWETTRNALIREFYKQSRVSPFEIVFSSDGFIDSTRQLQYYQENLGVLRENIVALTGEITTFKENKAKAEKLRNELAGLRDQYQALLAYSQRELTSTSIQLSQVKSSIKNLTAKQEQLILEKFAQTSQSETIGETEPVSVPLPNPGFSPAFAFATYGYPHRVGMNQYGAYGRSKDGQSYKRILSDYYSLPTSNIKKFRPRNNIHIVGCNLGSYSESACQLRGGTYYDRWVDFETYIKGLGEMPTNWGSSSNKGMNALKAQAVAARSYAWSYTSNGSKSICPSALCQYWTGSPKGSYWDQAVDATKDEVIMYGGASITAYYHSTAGGYTLNSEDVWTSPRPWAKGIKDFGPKGAYDGPKYGNSPWYHKPWGSRTGSGYNPWMTEEEVSDIFNALLLSKQSDSYNKYLSPIDKGGWSMKQVRDELEKLGKKPATSIKAVVTTPDGKGNTKSIYLCGGKYSCSSPLTFSGRDFRAMFNLRSRGSLVIWTSYFDLIRP